MSISVGELAELIHKHGSAREQMRMELRTDSSATFAADLVFQDESGFELWLGGLEDALSLEALESNKINGILNCALEDCQLECACSRPAHAGRRRSHARGPSAMNGGGFKAATATAEGCRSLDRDQIRELANFDGDWYSTIMDRDIEYMGIAAVDALGYPMEEHFSDTCAFLAQCQREGRKVLVHCIQGINRSSAALVAFLCHGVGMQLLDAIALTSSRRGLVLSNDDFLAQLIRHYGHGSLPKLLTEQHCIKTGEHIACSA